ncbi:Rv0340 family IniB-related protein [Mycobacterium shigaense]|uniref:Uncharacterized protein n=1 Tax=Mycobacterium shigaense TaxID=722731 RepID=A0A1Z4ECP2_9MYCO|nr:IniB N-terminal domain-containing protein [Mycobacterium shigaense]MEA1122420.1 Rv0340 family IniB-related protein [Mycobacterium shigaense]PRI17343.1 hypothetical protein B2J96_01050 [Mycobacterium shigaense]BAX90708.1 hypothetical protein MSG_00544 [Mycobacterium shigaense]
MANSLLDFVIALVRDPDAAARYAANPAQSIADAHLTNVTSADVNNLIPMVSDSLSMSGSGIAGAGAPVADHGNVWASGAAAAALDAFTPQVPAAPTDPHPSQGGVISQPPTQPPAPAAGYPHPLDLESQGPSPLLTGADVSDPAVHHGGLPADDPGIWAHPGPRPHPADPDHHDFGIHG